jgi:ABC-type dipeptide/oligopeptide/nickel transport system ATPase component
MLLEVKNLSVSYKDESGCIKEAARDVSFSLGKGEVLGLLGESGSGKSSVAMSIPRLLPVPPAFYPQGQIFFDGEEILTMPLSRLRKIRGEKIGVIFQDPMGSLSPLWKIADQMVEKLLLHRDVSKSYAHKLALEWLDKVSVVDPERVACSYPHELSGGMQQRVMIAMALMLEPSLIIADEPTTALDVTVQKEVLSLIKKLNDFKSAVLLISHDLGVISYLSTQLAVMKDGVVVEKSNDIKNFFEVQSHPYSPKLVAEAKRMSL